MTKNFAHRGFSANFPENTLLAFEKAIEAGAEGIEFDVHLTRDGIPVIHHDEKLERTTNGTGLIGKYTFDELQQLDASGKFKGLVPPQRIPSLRQYFELVSGANIISNIELKNNVIQYPEIEQRVLDLIEEFNAQGDVIVSSFNHYSIRSFKKLAPEIQTGVLEESQIVNPGEYAKSLKAENYHPYFHSLTDEIIQNLHAHQIKINAWTINDSNDMLAAIKMKLDGIITNYPDILSKLLQEASRK